MEMKKHECSLSLEFAGRHFALSPFLAWVAEDWNWLGQRAVHLGSCDGRAQRSCAGLSVDLCLHCTKYIQYQTEHFFNP